MTLLHDYAARNSEVAFEELVSRRIGFVYSAALRQVDDPHLAQEITQAVFVILAQKAHRISKESNLAGWLFKTTRFVALAQRRASALRRQREQELQMQADIFDATPDPVWALISPYLDEALMCLGAKDRQTVLLHYFDKKSFAEVGALLGMSEVAARKRADRALDKLRTFLSKRAVASTAAAIAVAIGANSVHAAPVGMAATISATAIKGSAVAGSTLALVKGALEIMAWTKLKTVALVSTAVLLAGGTTTLVVKEIRSQSYDQPVIDESLWKADNDILERVPPVLIIRPTKFAGHGGGIDMGGRAIWMDASISSLLGVAYEFPPSHMILPSNLPKGRFDLMLTLPDHPKDALRTEIKRCFGLIGHIQTVATNILLLKVRNTNAPGLKPIRGGNAAISSSDIIAKSRELHKPEMQDMYYPNSTMPNFAIDLAFKLKQQVRDQTRLTGHFEILLQWRAKDGETENDAFKRAVLDQLGLELVPNRESIEMLVVEKVK